jgi:hypothetical protein
MATMRDIAQGRVMSRRPATITQADVRRILRAAKQEGAARVEVYVGGARVVIHTLSTGRDNGLVESKDIIL